MSNLTGSPSSPARRGPNVVDQVFAIIAGGLLTLFDLFLGFFAYLGVAMGAGSQGLLVGVLLLLIASCVVTWAGIVAASSRGGVVFVWPVLGAAFTGCAFLALSAAS
ncbi:hypothetical protein HJ588_10425 [Flexivirga sp. ID2601S]|uniref:Uncharacterized protein n=1 Tax=Flexivirga aerilata TaxID=1656889 RepID=A0A849AGW5_9MICO|nr:hypothetical protein [Flexivirga aerilata]NNG39685.1 hypothetical protein [Flexivirga aerilata]